MAPDLNAGTLPAQASGGEQTSGFENVLAACSLTLGLFALGTMIAVGYLNYTTFPWFDGWAYWTEYLNARSWTFIFDKMNEHRIVLTRLLHIADTFLFQADARLLVWSNFVVQLGTVALLYRLTRCSFNLSPANRIYALGLILTFAFAAPQWINFTWLFLTCFLTVPFSALAAFMSLRNAAPDGPQRGSVSWRWLLVTVAMALVATGSMTHGLLVWPLLVLMAATLRLPARVTGSLAVAGVVLSLAYAAGKPVAQGSILKSLTTPWQIIPFQLAYLGSAFDEPMLVLGRALGRDWQAYRVLVTATAGTIGLVWVLYLAQDSLRKLRSVDRNRLAMLYTLGFFVASSVLTAFGRTGFSVETALTARYVTVSLLFWACLLLIATSSTAAAAPTGSPFRRYGTRVLALIVACFIGGFPQLPKVMYAANTERYLAEGEFALINDVFSNEAWDRFYYNAGEMIPIVRYFRDHRLSLFSRDWTHWLGESVTAHYSMASPANCYGAWETSRPAGGSYNPAVVASGWGFDRRFGRAPSLMVFADDSHRIVGFATGTWRRPDLSAALPEAVSSRVGWNVYLPAGRRMAVTAYVLLGDGRSLCEVGKAQIAGAYYTAAASKAGPVLPGVEAIAHGDWVRNDLAALTTTPPFSAEIWSSQGLKSDASLTIGPLWIGSGARVGLPLITSTAVSRIRVAVVDRVTKKVLATANPPPGLSKWDLWRLEMPAGAPSVVLDYVVEDDDHDPNSWVAVGLPRALNP